MPRSATRDDVQRLLQEGAQLVDVLPEAEYRDEHIAGAVSIPLKKLDPRPPSPPSLPRIRTPC